MECPLCGSRGSRFLKPHPSVFGVYECRKCRALFGECYLGDSYSLVSPMWSRQDVEDTECRYFDFICVGSGGITRRHGWFNPADGRIVQTG